MKTILEAGEICDETIVNEKRSNYDSEENGVRSCARKDLDVM